MWRLRNGTSRDLCREIKVIPQTTCFDWINALLSNDGGVSGSRGPGLHILKALQLLLQNVDRKFDALKVIFALGLDGLLQEEKRHGNP
jgi:hypothetical protein